jgi:hypothetical protein
MYRKRNYTRFQHWHLYSWYRWRLWLYSVHGARCTVLRHLYTCFQHWHLYMWWTVHKWHLWPGHVYCTCSNVPEKELEVPVFSIDICACGELCTDGVCDLAPCRATRPFYIAIFLHHRVMKRTIIGVKTLTFYEANNFFGVKLLEIFIWTFGLK